MALTEAFRHVQAGRHDDALRAVDAYLALPTPMHAGQAHFVAGLSFHRRQLYENARQRFERAATLEPEYVTTFFFYGFTLINLGRLDEAQEALERYLAADPEAAEAHFGLGLIAFERDRGEEAERVLRRAIELAQRAPGARRDVARYQARLGDVYLRRDDLPQARAAFESSVALAPDLAEPWHKLALVLRRLGDTAGAEQAQARSRDARARREAQREVRP